MLCTARIFLSYSSHSERLDWLPEYLKTKIEVDEFINLHHDDLRQYCCGLRLRPEDAKDLAQETLMKVYAAFKRYDRSGLSVDDFRKFTFKVLHNTLKNRIRNIARHREISLDEMMMDENRGLYEDPLPLLNLSLDTHKENLRREQEQDFLAQLKDALIEMINSLDEEEKQLLDLWMDGRNDEEIAMHFKEPVKYTRYKKTLLKKKLRRRAKVRAVGDGLVEKDDFYFLRFSQEEVHFNRRKYDDCGRTCECGEGDNHSMYLEWMPNEVDIAKLIEAFGYDFLVETLALDSEMFRAIYRQDIEDSARRELLRAIEAHWASCTYCHSIDQRHQLEDSVVDACLTMRDKELIGFRQWRSIQNTERAQC